MYASPFLSPEQFDFVVAAGVASPGVATVGRPKRGYKLDEKQAPGTAGTNITLRGTDAGEFAISVQMWTSAQLDAWAEWRKPWVWQPLKAPVQPVEVLHPILDEMEIHTAIATEEPTLEYKGAGMWVGTINAKQWLPPPKKNTTSSPSSAKGGANQPPKAKDALDNQIDALLKQAQKP